MKSTITQIISRTCRNPDGSRGPLTVFIATEAHAPGYETSSNDIAAAYATDASEANGRSVLAQLLLGSGAGTLTFSEKESTLSGSNGCTVKFASVRKLSDVESFACRASAGSDFFY